MKAIYWIGLSLLRRSAGVYSVSSDWFGRYGLRSYGYKWLMLALLISPCYAADLTILKMGLGSGSITSSPAGINCGADCQESFANETVTLVATADANSTFAGWAVDPYAEPSTSPDCSGTSDCVVSMSVARSLRPVFNLNAANAIPPLTAFTPEAIQTYLNDNPQVDTLAELVKALPADFKQNWILMSRSESLQTGTAEFPRLLLPSASAQFVFSLGVAEHSAYPGAHPNAIEYMQWDPLEKNFRFHEIILGHVDAMDHDGDGVGLIPERDRGVSIDDDKCSKCHTSRNVMSLDRSVTPPIPGTLGTDGIPPGSVKVKNKPNWDPYDSWGGMLPFNRDRIYQGSVEAAAFRKLLNPWTWQNNPAVLKIIEQLELQPPCHPVSGSCVPAQHRITRRQGGVNDGHIQFVFDTSPPVLTEPAPSGSTSSISNNYTFDGSASGAATPLERGGTFITLHHSNIPDSDEGRGVRFFDALGGLASSDLNMDGIPDGNFNAQRIADELVTHAYATGSIPIDIRPVALAVAKGNCLRRDVPGDRVVSNVGTALTVDGSFFDARHGLTINQLVDDTRVRTQSMPLRKADIQKQNLDRSNDTYVTSSASSTKGLIQEFGGATSAGAADTSLARIRQEVFRRITTAGACPGSSCPDSTVMGGVFVDREVYGNTETVSLFRYFLEPLGVSVDKWSTGVRGRSRTYAFADVFGSYLNVFVSTLRQSLIDRPVAGITDPNSCDQLITAINSTLGSLPDATGPGAIPKYTDVQRIFNKNCIECHGGLDYPPYNNYGNYLDFSEDEAPPAGDDRLDRSHALAASMVGLAPPDSSFLYQRVTDDLRLIDATNPEKTRAYNPATHVEDCPFGLMPCGGPPISQADILTLRRWMIGTDAMNRSPNTRGDPHIRTVDGTHYDFQAAGEFVLLRDQDMELQTRQTAVATESPLGPNGHTGLTSCVSLNTAVAMKLGQHRISYQPIEGREANAQGLQLRVDGKPVNLGSQGIALSSGGRIIPTSSGGIQVETPGGTAIIVTPGFWDYYQLWHLNIDTRYVRATEGLMGLIPSGQWLPALPDGSLLGPKPSGLQERYVDLYEKFGKAWRVTDSSSLFDYAPGTSTQSFTISSWPQGESPRSCIVPPTDGQQPDPESPASKPPVKALAIEVAKQHCAALINPITREHCEQDVRVTGEPGFAKTYLLTEKRELNAIPTAPSLVFPSHNQTLTDPSVTFTWDKSTDANGDPVTYRHCVWELGEKFNFNHCQLQPDDAANQGLSCALIALIIGCVILLILFVIFGKKKPGLFVLATLLVLIAVILAHRFCDKTTTQPQRLTTSTLASGKVYYWKVIAEDANSGISESKTYRFEVK